ncbi:MAG: PaaI family thioesterase [Promethearchaeota archaeon]
MEDLKRILNRQIPYYNTLGLELLEIKKGEAIFELEFWEGLTQNGILHGGVLASLIDSSCAYAALSTIYPDGFVTMIDLQIEYLRPVSKGKIIAFGRCIKSGKRIFFYKSKIRSEYGYLICTGSSHLMRI